MGIINKDREYKRKKRVSANLFGSKKRPRVSVYASNVYTYAQIIDDQDRKTLISYSSLQLSRIEKYKKEKKVEEAKRVGMELAKKAKELGIREAVFDRGKYSYKGRVKALAEGLREGGLKI